MRANASAARCSRPLEVAVTAAAAHRVHEVVGDVDSLPRPDERLGLEHVTLVQLDLLGRQVARPAGASYERTHVGAVGEQPLREDGADEPGGSCDERAHEPPVYGMPISVRSICTVRCARSARRAER